MTDLEPDSDSDSDAQPRVLLPEFLLNERELAFITAKFPEAMALMREKGTQLINDPENPVMAPLDSFMVFFFIEKVHHLNLEAFDMPDGAEVFAEAFKRLG
jgi:hypothetical protein